LEWVGLKTLVDESLTRDERIVFEGNTLHEAIRMSYRDYADLERPQVADFSRDR
jgi:Ala-tRNA(Pro) deacylase